MVGGLEARAQLAGGEGVALVGEAPAGAVGVVKGVHPDRRLVACGVEGEVDGGGKLLCRLRPGRVGVAAEHGEELVHGHFRAVAAVPAGGGPEGHVKAHALGEPFQRQEVFGVVHKLVFYLDADDGSAVLVKEALHLLVYVPVPYLRLLHVAGVVVPDLEGLFQYPVGEAAVAGLAVAPGAYADDDVEPGGLGVCDEFSQVPVAGEVEAPLRFLVVYPEDVGGDGGYASGAHFGKLPRPVFAPVADIVVLPHHADPGLAVTLDIK